MTSNPSPMPPSTLHKLATELTKGSVIPSRPERVQFGKDVLELLEENATLKEQLQMCEEELGRQTAKAMFPQF